MKATNSRPKKAIQKAPCLLPKSTTSTTTLEVDAPNHLTYGEVPKHFHVGDSVSLKIHLDGKSDKFTVDPALPDGLHLDTSTGNIKGVAKTSAKTEVYTITGENAGGHASDTLQFGVLPVAPNSFEYGKVPKLFHPGEPVHLKPTLSGKSIANSKFVVFPDLPKGVHLDIHTGAIEGVLAAGLHTDMTEYIVTARNAGGKSNCKFRFAVMSEPPKGFSYGHVPKVLHPGDEVHLAPISNVDHDTFTVSPPLPHGLHLAPSTGDIHGTLHEDADADFEKYYVTAKNAAGKVQTVVEFAVKPRAPSDLRYRGISPVYAAGATINWVPSFTHGRDISFSVKPDLPNDLHIDTRTGRIQGVLGDTAVKMHRHTVTAENIGGKATFVIKFSVNKVILTYHVPHTFVVGKSYTLAPHYRGFKPIEFSVSPALPEGLQLDEETGKITGKITKASTPHSKPHGRSHILKRPLMLGAMSGLAYLRCTVTARSKQPELSMDADIGFTIVMPPLHHRDTWHSWAVFGCLAAVCLLCLLAWCCCNRRAGEDVYKYKPVSQSARVFTPKRSEQIKLVWQTPSGQKNGVCHWTATWLKVSYPASSQNRARIKRSRC
jgi:hypothetical protein